VLEGIRIVEVEGLGAAPFAGMLLADLGADVVVVHRPESRASNLFSNPSLIDRGKRSIELDLKQSTDSEVFKQLIATADGLIEGFRPGVMERLGMGPDDCFNINARLIYGRLTGWGQRGGNAQLAGHDLNFAAMSGAAWYASNAGEPPFPPPTLIGDAGGGALYLVVGMLSAMLKARETGCGCVVDAAIVDGSAHLMNVLMSLQQTGAVQNIRGTSLLDGPHFSRCYETADGGYMSVQCLESAFYAAFLERLGLSNDDAFSAQFDKQRWPELTSRLSRLFLEKTRKQWEAVFSNSDACVAPVLSPAEALVHNNNRERQTWFEHNGTLQAAAAPRFSTQAPFQPGDSPQRDQHRKELLAELATINK